MVAADDAASALFLSSSSSRLADIDRASDRNSALPVAALRYCTADAAAVIYLNSTRYSNVG